MFAGVTACVKYPHFEPRQRRIDYCSGDQPVAAFIYPAGFCAAAAAAAAAAVGRVEAGAGRGRFKSGIFLSGRRLSSL